MTSTIDKIMRVCRNTPSPARFRSYLETLKPHQQHQKLDDLLASEALHGRRDLDAEPVHDNQPQQLQHA